MLTPPIEPMPARASESLPTAGHVRDAIWQQEVDGYRVIAYIRSGKLHLQSRRGAALSGAFPDLVAAAARVEEDLVVDRELVVLQGGRVRAYEGAEAIIAGSTGTRRAPTSLLLGRYDHEHRLRLTARTTPLPATARRDLGLRLTPGGPQHPWDGVRFSAGWGARGDLLFEDACAVLR